MLSVLLCSLCFLLVFSRRSSDSKSINVRKRIRKGKFCTEFSGFPVEYDKYCGSGNPSLGKLTRKQKQNCCVVAKWQSIPPDPQASNVPALEALITKNFSLIHYLPGPDPNVNIYGGSYCCGIEVLTVQRDQPRTGLIYFTPEYKLRDEKLMAVSDSVVYYTQTLAGIVTATDIPYESPSILGYHINSEGLIYFLEIWSYDTLTPAFTGKEFGE